MKKIFTIMVFCLIYNLSFGQNFVESTEFKLTKFDTSLFEKFHTSNGKFDGNTDIFIIDNNGGKVKKINVFIETYENDGKVLELIKTKLTNIRKIIKLRIDHCACYCDTSIYYWLITDKNKWIELPTIELEDYEFGLKTKDYDFSSKKRSSIELYEYQDELIYEKDNEEPKIKRKSGKILKTLIWNGKILTEK